MRGEEHEATVQQPQWAVAIFAARETPAVLLQTIQAVVRACQGRDATVDVLVNGNETLAEEVWRRISGRTASTEGTVRLRIWRFDIRDKATVWNKYVYELAPEARLYYFIDGYARVQENALRALDEGLARNPQASAATGVPTHGRSAKRLQEIMLREGGIHGNLYAIRGEVVDLLRDSGFFMPAGLYRTDAFLGAGLCFDFDPTRKSWNTKRIHVEPRASWSIDPLSWKKISDIIAHFRKMLRQAQGDIENCAYSHFFGERRMAPRMLPKTSVQMCLQWMQQNKIACLKLLLRKPLSVIACRKVLSSQVSEVVPRSPCLVGERLFVGYRQV